MSIKFHTIEGKEKDIRKEIIRQDDLIIEGGSGSNLYQLKKFRKFGYTGHYVLMDLMYPDNSLEKPSVFITHHGERLYYFSYGGNCFRADHVRPVIERFNAKNPVFRFINPLSKDYKFEEKFGMTSLLPQGTPLRVRYYTEDPTPRVIKFEIIYRL